MSLDQIVMMFDEAQFNSSAWIWWKIMVQAKLDLIKIVDSKRKILILDFQRQYSCNRKPKTKRKIESQNIRSFLTWFELWPSYLKLDLLEKALLSLHKNHLRVSSIWWFLHVVLFCFHSLKIYTISLQHHYVAVPPSWIFAYEYLITLQDKLWLAKIFPDLCFNTLFDSLKLEDHWRHMKFLNTDRL